MKVRRKQIITAIRMVERCKRLIQMNSGHKSHNFENELNRVFYALYITDLKVDSFIPSPSC
jgi:hypothetical protein